jgi:signal transduction histidine kinase
VNTVSSSTAVQSPAISPAGEPPVGVTPALTEPAERGMAAPPEVRSPEERPDTVGRMQFELTTLCDGVLKRLEADRARVVALLGDELVSVLTMARYLIEDAAQRFARNELEDGNEALQNASARIRDATNQVVALCCELRPKALDDLGLLAALSSYFRDFGEENRAVFVSPRITISEADVPVDLRLTIFRIVEAALSNVARHSKASAVRIFLSSFEGELRLGIEDDGVGFDVERWRHRRRRNEGCGLGMILRWVENTGGRCSIEAYPRHGTRIQVFWRNAAAALPAREPEQGTSTAASPAWAIAKITAGISHP